MLEAALLSKALVLKIWEIDGLFLGAFNACVETVLTAQPGKAKKLQPIQTALFPKLDSSHPSRANPTKFSSIKE